MGAAPLQHSETKATGAGVAPEGEVEVHWPKTGARAVVRFEAQPILKGIVPGAEVPPEPLGEELWCIRRYCASCDAAHDYAVRSSDVRPVPAPGRIGQASPTLDTSRDVTFTPLFEQTRTSEFTLPNTEARGLSGGVLSSEDIAKVYEAHRPAPADAAAAYHPGARLARSNDPDDLARAMKLLRRAREIYLDNDRIRDAAYATVVLAECHLKLGKPEEARAEIASLADGSLQEEDVSMNRRLARLEEQLAAT